MNILFVIAGFGSVAVGYIGANPLWILLLALVSFFGTFLNPFVVDKMQSLIDNDIGEATRRFLWTYVSGVFIVSLYYGIGALVGWLIK